MAIRKRNIVKDTGVSTSEEIQNDESSTKPKNNHVIPDVSSFKAQTIQVLNILESKGINIYDETRTPGMYLKKSGNKVSKNLIQNLLSGDKNHNKSSVDDNDSVSLTNKNQKAPQGLFDFFLKQKSNI